MFESPNRPAADWQAKGYLVLSQIFWPNEGRYGERNIPYILLQNISYNNLLDFRLFMNKYFEWNQNSYDYV